jgi:excisionase family DNA binding protein
VIDSNSTPPAPLLSPDELAVRYQVTGKTIRRWWHEGRIPAAVAVGRTLRFDPEEVAEALRSDANSASAKKHHLLELI